MTAAINQYIQNNDFIPYVGYMYGLCVDKNYLVFKWNDDRARILFSVCRRGDACCIHYTHGQSGAAYIREASNAFVRHVFWMFPWCKMIIGNILKDNEAANAVAKDCDFDLVARSDAYNVWVKSRED